MIIDELQQTINDLDNLINDTKKLIKKANRQEKQLSEMLLRTLESNKVVCLHYLFDKATNFENS